MRVGRKRLRVRPGPGASRSSREGYWGVFGVPTGLRESLLASYGLRMRILGCEGCWFGGGMLVSGRSEWDLGWSGVNWVGVESNVHFQKAPVVARLECCEFKGIQSDVRDLRSR